METPPPPPSSLDTDNIQTFAFKVLSQFSPTLLASERRVGAGWVPVVFNARREHSIMMSSTVAVMSFQMALLSLSLSLGLPRGELISIFWLKNGGWNLFVKAINLQTANHDNLFASKKVTSCSALRF